MFVSCPERFGISSALFVQLSKLPLYCLPRCHFCACGMCVSSFYFFIYVYLVLVVAEVSPDLDSRDHSLPELGLRVHDPASGVCQASVYSCTFIDLYCERIPEKSLRFITGSPSLQFVLTVALRDLYI